MESFKTLEGVVTLLDLPNVDTDQIIPKQFLKRIERTGFGEYLFYDWRFIDGKRLNPNFEMNAERFFGATILLARANFGCGSSREHAPWALCDYGIRAIIAPSYADIFYNNCFKNGMLPVILPAEAVGTLFVKTRKTPGFQLIVDLETQQVRSNDGLCFSFNVDAHRRDCLLNGLDDIGQTLKQEKKIAEYEQKQRAF
jgi:3-isopropylmalate/(R)-2-methylmalate dehydratase small subunit